MSLLPNPAEEAEQEYQAQREAERDEVCYEDERPQAFAKIDALVEVFLTKAKSFDTTLPQQFPGFSHNAFRRIVQRNFDGMAMVLEYNKAARQGIPESLLDFIRNKGRTAKNEINSCIEKTEEEKMISRARLEERCKGIFAKLDHLAELVKKGDQKEALAAFLSLRNDRSLRPDPHTGLYPLPDQTILYDALGGVNTRQHVPFGGLPAFNPLPENRDLTAFNEHIERIKNWWLHVSGLERLRERTPGYTGTAPQATLADTAPAPA